MGAVAVCGAGLGEQSVAANDDRATTVTYDGIKDYFGRIDLGIDLDKTRDRCDDPFYGKENIEHLEELKRLDDMGLLKFTNHEMQDDAWCEDLLERYLADPDESKHDTVTLEEFAAREGITL